MKYIDKIKMILEGIYDPHIFKAVIVVGSPAAGKSELSYKLKDTYGLKIIDSDPALELLMDRAGLDLDMQNLTPDEHLKKDALRDLAKNLRDKDLDLKLNNALGIVYPTIIDSEKIKSLKDSLENKGYETFLVFIDVPLHIAIERNNQRPRKVPENIVVERWRKSHEEYTKVADIFNSNIQTIDGTKSPEDYNLNRIREFLNSPVKNPKAQNWINLQVQLKQSE